MLARKRFMRFFLITEKIFAFCGETDRCCCSETNGDGVKMSTRMLALNRDAAGHKGTGSSFLQAQMFKRALNISAPSPLSRSFAKDVFGGAAPSPFVPELFPSGICGGFPKFHHY